MSSTYTWQTDAIAVDLTWSDDAPVAIADLRSVQAEGPDSATAVASVPLVQVQLTGEGRTTNVSRTALAATCASRMRHVDHRASQDGQASTLTVLQRDDLTRLEATTTFLAFAGTTTLSATIELRNAGVGAVAVDALALTLGVSGVVRADGPAGNLLLYRGTSAWASENRWRQVSVFGQGGLAVDATPSMPMQASSSIRAVGRSTWTTDGDLPTGVLENGDTANAVAWDVEACGAPWTWELALADTDPAAPVVALGLAGPNCLDHAWTAVLRSGETTSSPRFDLALADTGRDGAIGQLTLLRRALRARNAVETAPSLIFNDYMNTLNGDPTTEKLLPLIDSAADVGAEVFCIDAGWYDDSGNWWPSVGEWKPSTTRFGDTGLSAVLAHIVDRGMVPGLWVEPESVGVDSQTARTLPDEAFISRNGVRVAEHSRHLLDFRCQAVRDHLDATFERLIGMGAGMFKLDYNVTPGLGPDSDAPSTGAGLVAHRDAYVSWFTSLRARHPEVVFENCSSGALRQDFGQVSMFDLQSTSDQQSHELYAPIAAAAPMQLPLELCGNWAYPHRDMPEEEFIASLVNGLAGRLYLAGYLNQMDDAQVALVREAVGFFKGNRDALVNSIPTWPTGLPEWDAPQIVLGHRTPDTLRIFAWNRSASVATIRIPLTDEVDPGLPTVVFPASAGEDWTIRRDPETGDVLIDAAAGLSARVIDIPLHAN